MTSSDSERSDDDVAAVGGAAADVETDEASAEAMRATYERRAAHEAEVSYEGELPADIAGTPFAIFRATDIWDRLASHPDTRAHIADSGFRSAVEKLRRLDGQAAAREVMDDPRLLQAVMAMTGEGRLKLKEEELARAEVGGRMRRRDPVQFSHMERAHSHASCDEAREAGNEHFKRGEYADAAACYERALRLAGKAGGGVAVRVTLLSNRAAAMLKLRRAEEALRCCQEAAAQVEAADQAEGGAEVGASACAALSVPAAVLSKVYFRMAQALEMKRQFGEAAEAAEKALGVAEGGTGRGGGAGGVGHARDVVCDAATLAALRRELSRLAKLAQRARDDAAEAVRQREREAAAAALRGAGIALPPEARDTAGGPPGAAGPGAVHTGLVHTGVGRGYIREVDLSHWAMRWLGQRLRGLTHKQGGCTVVLTAMAEAQSEVRVSCGEWVGGLSVRTAHLVGLWRGGSCAAWSWQGVLEGPGRVAYSVLQTPLLRSLDPQPREPYSFPSPALLPPPPPPPSASSPCVAPFSTPCRLPPPGFRSTPPSSSRTAGALSSTT